MAEEVKIHNPTGREAVPVRRAPEVFLVLEALQGTLLGAAPKISEASMPIELHLALDQEASLS